MVSSAHVPLSPAWHGPWYMLRRDPGEQTYSGCRPPGESTLSPGPGGEESEEGQVRGLRGALATCLPDLLPLQMGTWCQEHCVFTSKQMAGHLLKNCQDHRQDGFPAPCISSRQGQRAGPVDLGGLKASLPSGGRGTGGFCPGPI